MPHSLQFHSRVIMAKETLYIDRLEFTTTHVRNHSYSF
jgi:hypothetical protein